ncbi:uncharacterized protein LOC130674170 [Microplitis mediator]|uniref:uncharacterized protein LOC130674170 n=1 Tax=Microplitis mediator TaxID=375433 RepID=UPI0025552104|nr:uncharacterized protein LOC130674170 [Microplitis mediator]
MKNATQKPDVLPIYLVTVNNTDDIAKLLKIKTIASFRIRWDPYRNIKKVPQCFRCQQFEHGITNCHNPPKCVKCPLSHLTSECPNSKDIPAICANCRGLHPASHRLCPKYIEHQKKVEQHQLNRKKTNNIDKAITPHHNQYPALPKIKTRHDSYIPTKMIHDIHIPTTQDINVQSAWANTTTGTKQIIQKPQWTTHISSSIAPRGNNIASDGISVSENDNIDMQSKTPYHYNKIQQVLELNELIIEIGKLKQICDIKQLIANVK